MIAIMSDDLIKYMVGKADKRREIDGGSYLFHQGDRVEFIFVVEYGLVELTRTQTDGAPIILQRATDKTVIAEASMYSDNYHCDGTVAVTASVFAWSKKKFIKHIEENKNFSNLWARHLAGEIQASRYRSEILSRKTVADRLDGWLAWQGGNFPDKGQWKNIAAQIGVAPESLYRELAKRRIITRD